MARPRSVAARQIRRRFLIAGALLLALLVLLVVPMLLPRSEPEEVAVFAAASLAGVMRALETDFEAAYPDADLVVVTAATSELARRIEQGEPADVFFAAGSPWTDSLAERDLLRYPARAVFGNALVVIGPPGALPLGGLDGLLRFDRIALADPERVPAGQYAKAGLERAGLWDAVAPRVVPTPDVRAAVEAVRAGAVPAAVVYASDAAPGVRVLLAWPEALQPEIRYHVAIPRTTRRPNRALEFVEFVRQSERIGLWRRYGFEPLAEPVLR